MFWSKTLCVPYLNLLNFITTWYYLVPTKFERLLDRIQATETNLRDHLGLVYCSTKAHAHTQVYSRFPHLHRPMEWQFDTIRERGCTTINSKCSLKFRSQNSKLLLRSSKWKNPVTKKRKKFGALVVIGLIWNRNQDPILDSYAYHYSTIKKYSVYQKCVVKV